MVLYQCTACCAYCLFFDIIVNAQHIIYDVYVRKGEKQRVPLPMLFSYQTLVKKTFLQ